MWTTSAKRSSNFNSIVMNTLRSFLYRTLCCTALLAALGVSGSPLHAQELTAKVVINRSQVSNTKSSVFESLEKAVTAFLNDRQWTNQHYKESERISCTFNITVNTYNEADNAFTASLMVQSMRPVYNSTYNTTVFSIKDANFNFAFQEFDQLNFQPEQLDNNLTAMLAYYAYLIIGLDMDTMAPLGGTEALQTAENIVSNAQNLGYPGWKAFDDNKNRFGIINDYLDGAMEPYRQLQYVYYRKGLDTMADNAENGRAAITEAINLLNTAKENKSLSQLPQIFTDFKRDELVNIYSGKGTPKEKEAVYDIVFRINASQNAYWEKIKK